MHDLARFCCQNTGCTLYGKRDAGNLSVCGHYGKQKQFRQLYCNACRARFSERRGTPLYRCHLPEPTVVSVLDHLAEGNGIRQTGASSASIATPLSAWHTPPEFMPTTLMRSSWLFPPRTREVQFDEKWSFVGKKQKNCDPANSSDDHKGDWWDHVAYDPEHRLVLAVVPSVRLIENAEEIVATVRDRTNGVAPQLMTSDEYPAYTSAIGLAFGVPVTELTTGPGRRPILPARRLPQGLTYATVHKQRQNDRVVGVECRLILGTEGGLEAALGASAVSQTVNTSFVERQHGTDRGQNRAEDVPVQ